MIPSTAIDILLAHDRWATRGLLEACRPLGDEQLDRPFEMGLGSLRQTLVHLIEAVAQWRSAITRQPSPAEPPGRAPTVEELLARADQVADALDQLAADNGDADWTAERWGRRLTAPRDAFLTHLVTHSMHHRAQALNMLRHLGVQPLPESSVLQWMLASGVGRMQLTNEATS